MIEPSWGSVTQSNIEQGDYLPDCYVPIFDPDFGTGAAKVPVGVSDLIVVTQSCDLQNEKVRMVALCPIHSLEAFEEGNLDFKKKGMWEQVRKGRIEGLHMLGSLMNPSNNRESLVVDFREIYSLPFGYLKEHAIKLSPRWRLKSPFLEHFSQAFARFFMRVGLPSAIPKFE